MVVILDELTPLEFFKHGGVVKVTVKDDRLASDCNVKKKYIFYEYKPYVRFLEKLYICQGRISNSPILAYDYVNERLEVDAFIGDSKYVMDLSYDNVKSYMSAKFYYNMDKKESCISKRDPYGIKNVNFSLIDEDDDRWDEFAKQRLERGFDDSELWSLDGTIANFIYPRLKAFREDNYAFPAGMTLEEWNGILDEMIKGFELIASDDIKTEDEENMERRALDLFSEHFFGLWN